MTFKPLSNHVLVEPIAEEEKMTKSGIVLPDTVEKKKQSMGMVVDVGPGKMSDSGARIPVGVSAGQKVLFKEPWSDESKIKDGEKKFFLVEEEDILAVIESGDSDRDEKERIDQNRQNRVNAQRDAGL